MIFLYGMRNINAGPANVNRSLVEKSGGKIIGIKFKSKFLRLIEGIIKIIWTDTLIISPIMSMSVFMTKFAKRIGKKVVFLKHGDARYESEINHFKNMEHTIECEYFIMKHCDLILCVSEWYMNWNKNSYPEFADKFFFVNNGVNLAFREKKTKRIRSIAVSGGNRDIKNNYEVYQAIEYLNAHMKQKYTLYVFGREYKNSFSFLSESDVIYLGQLEKTEYYNMLDQIELFIVNSKVESFGLVVADALNTNCSLLLSRNVGAASILKHRETDYIEDSYDIKEIANKIVWTIEHPNAERIQNSVEINKVSEEYAVQKIIEVCEGQF